jgi:hypothetical protein
MKKREIDAFFLVLSSGFDVLMSNIKKKSEIKLF